MGTQKLWAQIIGVVLVLVGILGFFAGTGNYNLLNLFGVNVLHNVVHLVTGLIFLWVGFAKRASVKGVNQWLGVIYILIGVIGFFGVLSFLNVGAGNDPDNWLHLVIGVVSAAIGWFAKN